MTAHCAEGRSFVPRVVRHVVGLSVVCGVMLAASSPRVSAQVGGVALGAPDHVQERLPVFRFDTRALRVPIDTRATANPVATPGLAQQPDFAGPLNNLPAGKLLDSPRTSAGSAFPGMTATGWYPPEIGRAHV